MKKTQLIFQDNVINGYNHYRRFKNDFSDALAIFKKYILPIECDIALDANHDWLIFFIDHEDEELAEYEFDSIVDFLKSNKMPPSYPSIYDDWSMIVPIDYFVEYVLSMSIIEP